MMEDLVPTSVPYADFWLRYFLRVEPLTSLDEELLGRHEMIAHRLEAEAADELAKNITSIFKGAGERLSIVGGAVARRVNNVVENVGEALKEGVGDDDDDLYEEEGGPQESDADEDPNRSVTIEFGSPEKVTAEDRKEMERLAQAHAVAMRAKQVEFDALNERLEGMKEKEEEVRAAVCEVCFAQGETLYTHACAEIRSASPMNLLSDGRIAKHICLCCFAPRTSTPLTQP